MWRSRMNERPKFLKKFEVWEKRREIAVLFREALEAINKRDFEKAKKKLDKIMELSKDELPEIYFEACFKLAETFFEEDNYRGSVKCALRALYNAPTRELYLLGICRVRDMLFILREQGNVGVFSKDMDVICRSFEDNKELQAFVKGLIAIAKGTKDVSEFLKQISTPELKDALKLLVTPH